jgi:Domain of unknown function (DUF4190)
VPPPVEAAPQSYQAMQRGTNSLAIVSLVAGISGYVLPHPFIGGLVAIVTGHMARGQIRRTGEGGGGFALAGLLLGYLHLFLSLLLVGVILAIVFGFGAWVVSQPHSG